jgi:iron complex outermembrane receptor protein
MLPNLNRKWRYNSESDEMYNRNWNIAGKWVHRFNENLKLTENISYTDDDIDYFSTEELDYLTSKDPIYKHYYEAKPGVRTYICLDSLYYGYPLRFSHMAKTVNNQLELSGKFKTGSVVHNFMGGNTIIHLDRVTYTGYNFGPGGGDDVVGPGLTGHGTTYNPHSIGWMDTKFSKCTPQITNMLGIYFHDVMEFSDKWKAMFAGRYDWYSFKRASGIDVIDRGRKHGHVDSDKYSKLKTGAFTFKTGVVYLPIEDLSLFASYGTYFKPIRTFYNENTIYVDREGKIFTPTDGKEVFKPEKGGQFEIGARYDLNRKLRADFSLFYINKYNMTRTIASKGDVIDGQTLDKNVVGQVGKMNSKGFDIELSYMPVDGMVLSMGYAYTDAKVKEMAKNKYMDTDATKGKQYARIPKNTFFLMGDYVVPAGALKGFGVNFDVDFNDKVYRNANNTSWFDSYWLTNIGFSYNLKNGVRLGLNIKNLFNEKYFNQSLGNQMVPSQPRNCTVSVQYAF